MMQKKGAGWEVGGTQGKQVPENQEGKPGGLGESSLVRAGGCCAYTSMSFVCLYCCVEVSCV